MAQDGKDAISNDQKTHRARASLGSPNQIGTGVTGLRDRSKMSGRADIARATFYFSDPSLLLRTQWMVVDRCGHSL